MVYLLYFFSGFCALLYQVVWQRLIAFYAGSDGEATALVIGGFLTGLGLGSLISGKIATRLKAGSALRWFASCEFGIACFAALSPWLYHEVFFMHAGEWLRDRGVSLVLTYISLVLPTTLMGMCFPMLAHATTRGFGDLAARVGRLNALNILGAGTGCLVAGWFLIGSYGYAVTAYAGAGLSILVACGAWWLSTKVGDATGESSAAPAAASGDGVQGVARWCILMFASGFVAISLELIWFRVLSMMMGTIPHVFSLMLAFILVGYSLGGLIACRRLGQVSDPCSAFLKLQVWVLIVAVGTLLAVFMVRPFIPHAEVYMHSHSPRITGGVMGYAVRFALAALLLLPANMLIGAGFPLSQAALLRDRASVGRLVAWVQGSNILGNLLASLLTGFGFFTWFGTTGSLRLLMLVGIGFAVLALLRESRSWRAWVPMLLAVVVGLAVPGAAQWWRLMHLLGSSAELIVHEDHSGVASLGRRAGENFFTMYANGQVQGHTAHDGERHFPAVLAHEQPRRVLCIGIGAGPAVYASAAHPAVEHVEVCEILRSMEPLMSDFARQHPEVMPHARMLADKRFHFRYEDGRRLLIAEPDRGWDVIFSSPLLPYNSRSGLLFSHEFFELLKTRLNEGGIVGWLGVSPRTWRTFARSFPYVVLLEGEVLLGSNVPLIPRLESLDRRLGLMPEASALMKAIGYEPVTGPPRVLRRWDPETPRDIGDFDTDLHPLDEYLLNNPEPAP